MVKKQLARASTVSQHMDLHTSKSSTGKLIVEGAYI